MFSDMVMSVSNVYNTPMEYCLCAALGAVATAAGSMFRVQVGPHRDLLNLFCVAVGRPGANKSAPCRCLVGPLAAHNQLLYQAYVDQKRAYDQAPASEKPQPPVKHAVILSDVTMERMAMALGDNGRGLLLYRDEIGAYLQSLARYNAGGGEVRALCEIYDGHPLSIDRQGGALTLVQSPCLSMLGTTQPNSLSDVFGRKEIVDSGFLQRFCFFLSRDTPTFRPMQMEYGLPAQTERGWTELLESLLRVDHAVEVAFSQKTWAKYNKFLEISFNNQASTGDYEAQVWSKLNIILPKLAALAAVMERASESGRMPERLEIDRRHFEFGAELALYLRDTQMAVMGRMRGSQAARMSTRELVQGLCAVCEIPNLRQLASALSLPPSSVIRWAAKVRKAQEPAGL